MALLDPSSAWFGFAANAEPDPAQQQWDEDEFARLLQQRQAEARAAAASVAAPPPTPLPWSPPVAFPTTPGPQEMFDATPVPAPAVAPPPFAAAAGPELQASAVVLPAPPPWPLAPAPTPFAEPIGGQIREPLGRPGYFDLGPDAGKRLAQIYSTDIPFGVSDALRDVSSRAGDLGAALLPATPVGQGYEIGRQLAGLAGADLPATEDVGRFAGASAVPVSAGDVALTALPLVKPAVAGARATVRAGSRYATEALAAGAGGVPKGAVRRVTAPGALLRGEGSNLPRVVSPTEGEGLAAVRGGAFKPGEAEINVGDWIRTPEGLRGRVVGEGVLGRDNPAWVIDQGGGRTTPVVKDGATLWSKAESAAPTVAKQSPPVPRNQPPLNDLEKALQASLKGKKLATPASKLPDSAYSKGQLNAARDPVPVLGEQPIANTPDELKVLLRQSVNDARAAKGKPIRGAPQQPVGAGNGGTPPLGPAAPVAATRAAATPPTHPPSPPTAAGGTPPGGGVQSRLMRDELDDSVQTFIDTRKASAHAPTSGSNLRDQNMADVVRSEAEVRDFVRLQASDLAPEELALRTGEAQAAVRSQMLDSRFGAGTPERAAAEKIIHANEVESQAGGVASHYYDKMNNALRSAKLGFDIFAVGGQQLLRTGRAAPAGLTGLLNKVIEMGTGKSLLGDYAHDLNRLAWHTMHTGQFRAGGQNVGIEAGAARLPIRAAVKAVDSPRAAAKLVTELPGRLNDMLSTLQFQKAQGGAHLRLIEGLMLQNKAIRALTFGHFGADIADPVAMRRLEEFANAMSSTARLPAGARQRAISSRALLTGPMTSAQSEELLTLLKTGRSSADAINTANLVIGTALTFAAGKEIYDLVGAPGGEFTINPLDTANFGRITTKFKNSEGENIVWDFLPQASLAKTVFKELNALKEGDWKAMGDAMARFAGGRASIPASGALSTAAGVGYGEKGSFEYGGLSLAERARNVAPVPLSLQDTVLEGRRDTASIVAGQLGGNTYGESPYKQITREAHAEGADWGNMWKWQREELVDQKPELRPAYDRYLASGEGTAADIAAKKAGKLQNIAKLASSPATVNEYRDLAGRAVSEAAIAYEQAKIDGKIADFRGDPSDPRKVLDGYYDAIDAARNKDTGAVDYDLQDKLEGQYLSGLDPDVRDGLLRELTYSADPTYREYKEARTRLEPFWNAKDEAFLEYREQKGIKAAPGTPEAESQRFETYDEYAQWVYGAVLEEAKQRVAAGKMAPETMEYETRAAVAKYLTSQKLPAAVQYYKEQVIKTDPALMDLLRKWYPDDVAKYLLQAEHKVEALP